MADTPFKIQMNQDGAILKTSSSSDETFIVMPDYIKLEKASYPRMVVNPIEPWTEEEPPPEDYGKNIIDDTFEENWYYTFYCDSVEWDGREETLDKSGNGSKENPWRNIFHAINILTRQVAKLCCTKVRLMVSGIVINQYPKWLALIGFNGNDNITIDFKDALIRCVNTASDSYKHTLSDFSHMRLFNMTIYSELDFSLGHDISVYNLKFHSDASDIQFVSYSLGGGGIHSAYKNCDITVKNGTVRFISCVCDNIHINSGDVIMDIGVYKNMECYCSEFYSDSETILLYSSITADITKYYSVGTSTLYGCSVGLKLHTTEHEYMFLLPSIAGWHYNMVTQHIVYTNVDTQPHRTGITLGRYLDCYITDSSISCIVHITNQDYECGGASFTAVEANHAIIKNCNISIYGDLPYIADSAYAVLCPIDIEPYTVLLDCTLTGYKAVGEVPSGVCRS